MEGPRVDRARARPPVSRSSAASSSTKNGLPPLRSCRRAMTSSLASSPSSSEHEHLDRGGVERLEGERDRVVAPGCGAPALVELGARRGEQHERAGPEAVDEAVDEGEHEVVGPVQVGEHHDQRPAPGHPRRAASARTAARRRGPGSGRGRGARLRTRAGRAGPVTVRVVAVSSPARPVAATTASWTRLRASSCDASSGTSHAARTTSRSATTGGLAVGHALTGRGRSASWRSDAHSATSPTRRLLPTPASPPTRTRWARRRATAASRTARTQRDLGVAPDETGRGCGGAACPAARRAAIAAQASTGSSRPRDRRRDRGARS